MYIHVYNIHTHICTYIYIHAHTYIDVCICMDIYIFDERVQYRVSKTHRMPYLIDHFPQISH